MEQVIETKYQSVHILTPTDRAMIHPHPLFRVIRGPMLLFQSCVGWP